MADSQDGESTASTPDILTSSKTSTEEDTVPELPSVTALQHLGKARPKRPKKHAPTRGAVVQREGEDIHEGLDKFFTSPKPASPVSTPSSPSPRPRVESTSERSQSPSSPSMKNSDSKHKIGMSCLSSTAADEDDKTDKKSSPSVQSISDIFAKSASSKLTKPKEEGGKVISPFSTRKTETPSSSGDVFPRRRSFQPDNSEEDPKSPVDAEMGKRTPEEVVKRHGVGFGGTMMAEMKAKQEKRASFVPKEEEKNSTSLFGNVKLR